MFEAKPEETVPHLISSYVPKYATKSEMQSSKRAGLIDYAANFLEKHREDNPTYITLEDKEQDEVDSSEKRKTYRIVLQERLGEAREKASLDFYPSEITEKKEPTIEYVYEPPINCRSNLLTERTRKHIEEARVVEMNEEKFLESNIPPSVAEAMNFGKPPMGEVPSARIKMYQSRRQQAADLAQSFLCRNSLESKNEQNLKFANLDRYWFRGEKKAKLDTVKEEPVLRLVPPSEPPPPKRPMIIGKHNEPVKDELEPKSLSKTVQRFTSGKHYQSKPTKQVYMQPAEFMPIETFSSFELIRKGKIKEKKFKGGGRRTTMGLGSSPLAMQQQAEELDTIMPTSDDCASISHSVKNHSKLSANFVDVGGDALDRNEGRNFDTTVSTHAPGASILHDKDRKKSDAMAAKKQPSTRSGAREQAEEVAKEASLDRNRYKHLPCVIRSGGFSSEEIDI